MFELYVETIENNFTTDDALPISAIATDYGYRVYATGLFWQIVACIDGTWDLVLQNNTKGVLSNFDSLQYLCQYADKEQFIDIFCSLSDDEYVEF